MIVVLVVALAVSSSFALPHSGKGDRVMDLITTAAEYEVATLKKTDPQHFTEHFEAGPYPQFYDLINATLVVNDGLYSGFSDVVIDSVKTDPEKLSAQLQGNFPQVQFEGHYKIAGEAFGKKVSGEGKFLIRATNFTFAMSRVQLLETDKKALRIESAGLSADLAEIQVSTTGLKVDGMTVPAFEKLAGESMRNAFMKQLTAYIQMMEYGYIDRANEFIGDRTLEEVVQYLRENLPSAD